MPDEPVRAVVVDDEPASREAVIALLGDEPGVRVVGEARNGTEAVEVIRRLRPDLLFLDIQMPDRDGFQVIEDLGADVPRGLILVTAYDQHALRAFEVHALDYVLKPFGHPRFHAAVARALDRLRAEEALTLRSTLAAIAAGTRATAEPAAELALGPGSGAPVERRFPRRLGIRTGSKVVLLDVESIDWIEARGDYVRVHAGPRVHVIAERMHELERLLDRADFLRIHRSIIVNLGRVAELERDAEGAGVLTLRDGVRLRIARGRWDVLVAALGVREI